MITNDESDNPYDKTNNPDNPYDKTDAYRRGTFGQVPPSMSNQERFTGRISSIDASLPINLKNLTASGKLTPTRTPNETSRIENNVPKPFKIQPQQAVEKPEAEPSAG